MTKTGLLAATLFIGAGGAFAADLPSRAPPVPVAVPVFAQTWTGFYLGIQGNYHTGTINDRGCTGLCIRQQKVESGYAAIQGGYDYQLPNNVVLGVLGWAGITPVRQDATLAPGIVIRGRTDFAGFVGGRAGYAFGNILPYAFAGYEYADGKVQIAVAPIPINRRSHDGFGVGAGVEYLFYKNVSVDFRYMYSELGRRNYDFGGGVTSAGEHAHTFSVAINYRFGSIFP